jgi:hypothetical protein
VRPARRRKEALDLEVLRAGDVALARVAGIAAAAAELVVGADVEDRQLRVVEPLAQLLPGRHGLESRLERGLGLLQLHGALLELTRPGGDPAGEHGDLRMAGDERGLLRGGGADAVAAVVKHEPLVAGDPVAAEPPLHLDRELLDGLTRRQGRRRAEHERNRPRQVTALVRVRPAHVAEQEIFLAQVILHPGPVDERRQLRHRRGIRPAPR